jgi:F-box interacting protein
MPELITISITCGFGYDPFIDNYKVVVVLNYYDKHFCVNKTEVKIHTLGTNSWKTIQEFPFGDCTPFEKSGKFVSGTINWLFIEDLYRRRESRSFIVSLDLKNDSFQEILMPGDYGEVAEMLTLGVMRDWLCLFCGDDVWIMKEYGNEKSWTKLFTISLPPHVRKSDGAILVVDFIEDDQVFLSTGMEPYGWELIVYDSKNDMFKISEFHTIPHGMSFESLISPC